MRIMLDAGHGFNTAGKRTLDGVREAQQNYPVMMELGKILQEYGIDVKYTNTDINVDLPLDTRVVRSNQSKADLFVSIHKNAITGFWQTKAGGISTHIIAKGGEAEKVAKVVQASLVKETGMKDRGVRVDNFYVLRKTNCPAILIELGFMDNREEAKQMLDPTWHKKFAEGIAKGILQMYLPNFKPAPTVSKVNPKLDEIPLYKTESIQFLLDNDILNDPAWLTKVDEPVPLWAVAIMIERVIKKGGI